MLDVPCNPTALQYKYSFLSVSQLEGEDGLLCAQLLQHFKPNLEHLVQDAIVHKELRSGTKRKVIISSTFICDLNAYDLKQVFVRFSFFFNQASCVKVSSLSLHVYIINKIKKKMLSFAHEKLNLGKIIIIIMNWI